MIVFNESSLRRYLAAFRDYYHRTRTHLSLEKDIRRRIRPALEKVGLGWANFQAMRHTFGNKLAEVEKDPRVRAELMGYSVTVHDNEYRQASDKQKRRAMKRLGKLLQ